jgi:soluble lytic murein transglycosylase-like protein
MFVDQCRNFALAICLIAVPLAHASEDSIHMYKQPNGTRLYTDQKKRSLAYTYLGLYGRATYRVSCAGYRPNVMQSRKAMYQVFINQYAAQYKVDPVLVAAVMRVESCLDRRAVSRSGAKGLMQLMPGTAKELGVRDVFDPGENIRGGTAYLSSMLKRFENNRDLALAAYNAGPSAVERHGGVPPYKETQSYLKRVARQYQKYSASAGRP